jgi:hypothetical protein
MKALKNLYKTKTIQNLIDGRNDLIIKPVKFNFQGLAYYTGICIYLELETVQIEPVASGFILSTTSIIRKGEFFNNIKELRKYLKDNF